MKKNIALIVMALVVLYLFADKIYNFTHFSTAEKLAKENERGQESGQKLDAENPPKISVGKDSLTYAEKKIIPTQKIENTLSPKTEQFLKEHIYPQLKISAESVESVSKISAVASGEVKVANITLPDNTKIRISRAEKIHYSDKYTDIIIEKDSTGKVLPAKYQFNSDVFTVKTENKPIVLFWQKPKTVESFVFTNPNIKINNVENFTRVAVPQRDLLQLIVENELQISPKNQIDNQFSSQITGVINPDGFLSPNVGYGYYWNLNGGTIYPFLKVGLDLNLFRLRK